MTTDLQPRAPGARAKLEQAERIVTDLAADVAELALEASEGKAGAEKALAAHRAKIDVAERQVSELRSAVKYAERLDLQAKAAATAKIRADQFGEFKKAMAAREKAMTAMLQAAAMLATTYSGKPTKQRWPSGAAEPFGTKIQMSVGPNGIYGSFFGKFENLILAELFRAAPQRTNGVGRFTLPFAKPPSILTTDPSAFPPALEADARGKQANSCGCRKTDRNP